MIVKETFQQFFVVYLKGNKATLPLKTLLYTLFSKKCVPSPASCPCDSVSFGRDCRKGYRIDVIIGREC